MHENLCLKFVPVFDERLPYIDLRCLNVSVAGEHETETEVWRGADGLLGHGHRQQVADGDLWTTGEEATPTGVWSPDEGSSASADRGRIHPKEEAARRTIPQGSEVDIFTKLILW